MSSEKIESTRPTSMVVDLSAICKNYLRLKQHAAPAKVMAVVKANAYGHGLVATAQALEKNGVDYFGVALVEEGIELRRSGIKTPVLVFGGLFGDQIELYLTHDLEITASSVSKLQAINEIAKRIKRRARVHLKIDTGMGRIGIQYTNCRKLFDAALECQSVEIVGVFSHLATADEQDQTFALEQLHRFDECKSIYQSYPNLPKVLFHIHNSAGAISYPNRSHDMVRIGLALYGINPTSDALNSLSPAMKLRSQVVYFKVLPEGAPVSYGCTWTAPKMTRVVTIPIGYGDGFFRRLSNCGQVLIRGKRYPIIGRVCMDQMMIDVGWDEVFNGDEVVLIGRQGEEEISVSEVAKALDTIEHEVLTSTNLRVPRIYQANSSIEG